MKKVPAVCLECGESNLVEVDAEASAGYPTSTYCPICDDYTDHVVDEDN